MDIEDYNNSNLFLYAITSTELLSFEIDTESATVSSRPSIPISALTGQCNLIFENEQRNLFVSHGTGPYQITGYNIDGDGSLETLPGYPNADTDFTNPVENFIFDDNRSYLIAMSNPSMFTIPYLSDGSVGTRNEFAVFDNPATGDPGLFMYNGFVFKQDNNNSVGALFTIDGAGTLAFNSNLAVDALFTGASTTSMGYIYKVSGGAPNDVYSYETSPVFSQISNQSFGSGATQNNALVNDPENRFIYFVSDAVNTIFCIRTNTDGTIGVVIDEITTGNMPMAASIDPYKQFFFTSSNDGGWKINIHRMNGDLPENSFDSFDSGNQVLELLAVRYEN